MKKIILTLFFTLNLAAFLSCNCPDPTYYDYSGIELKVFNDKLSIKDSLVFGVQYKGTEYLVERSIRFDFSNKMYAAVDCTGEGELGEKYPLTKISIKSNADFNEQFPAGTNLNSIIGARGGVSKVDGRYVDRYGKISDFMPHDINLGYMYISSQPTKSKTHVFTIEIEKSNGSILTATSKPVVWE